eukprot:gene1849-1343_t
MEKINKFSPMHLVKGIRGESLASVAPDLTVEDLSMQPVSVVTHANLLDYYDSQRNEDDSSSSGMVKTQILRHRSNFNEYFYPRYQLLCTEPSVTLLMAIRPHFFSLDLDIYDVQAGYHGSRFVPSSRMYLGTLECLSQEHGIYRFIRKNPDGTYVQLAAFMAFHQEEAIGTVRLWKAIVPETKATPVVRFKANLHLGSSSSSSSQHSSHQGSHNDIKISDKSVDVTAKSTPAKPEKGMTDKDEALEKILVEVHRKYRLLPRGYNLFRSFKPVYDAVPKKHFAASMPKLIPPQLKSSSLRSCDGRERTVCSLTKSSADAYSCEFARPMSTLIAFAFSLCQLQA